MKKIEKQMKKDILNEIEVPNILPQLRPYAIEQAALFQKETRIIKTGYQRPIAILTTCFTSLVAVMLVVLAGISLKNGGMLKDSAPEKNADYMENAPSYNSEDANKYDKPASDNEQSFENFEYEYGNKVSPEMTANSGLEKYYNEIRTYVQDGKTKDEVLDIYKNDINISSEDVGLIYDYLSN